MRARWSLVAAMALVVAACGGGEESGAGETTVADAVTTTSPQQATGVSVAETSLGEVLVGPDGMTLYALAVDEPGVSLCYDSCAALWPPVSGDTPVGDGLDESLFSVTERDDGTTQLVAGGWPLYRYTGDTQPGDVSGQGVEGVWFVVDAGGDLVGAGEAMDDRSSDEAPTDAPARPADDDYGYDY